jgi:signal peptidase I
VSRRLPWRGLLAAVVLALVAVLVAGWLSGWRSHTMTTPSMGRTAPVGALVLSKPVAAQSVHVGEIIVFHPPGRHGTTFVHRVTSVSRDAEGIAIRTKGDINGAPDSWVLRPSNLIGRAAVRIPVAGYVLLMLPLLLIGSFVILLATSGLSEGRRAAGRILGASVLCGLALNHYQPLGRLALIGQQVSGGKGQAAVVPTGVLPLRISAVGGTHADLVPGQVGTVALNHISTGGAFRVNATVHLTGWWWLLLLTWAVPILWALSCANRPRVDTVSAADADHETLAHEEPVLVLSPELRPPIVVRLKAGSSVGTPTHGEREPIVIRVAPRSARATSHRWSDPGPAVQTGRMCTNKALVGRHVSV